MACGEPDQEQKRWREFVSGDARSSEWFGSFCKSCDFRQPQQRLPLDPLHSAAPDTDQCRHLQYALPHAQVLPAGVPYLWAAPSGAATCVNPAMTRSRSIVPSYSPKTDATWIIARPGELLSCSQNVGVEVHTLWGTRIG